MMGFFGAGIALAPIWALLIVPTLGWRWALFLTAPFALIGGLMRRGLPESPRWLARQGRVVEAETVLEAIEAQVEKSTGAPLPVIEARQPAAVDPAPRVIRSADLLGRAYRPLTLMLWAAWFAEYGVLYAFQTFVPTILAAEGFSVVKSYSYSIVIFFGVIPAYVLAGRVVEWIDRKYTIVLAFAASALFGVSFGYPTTATTLMLFGGLTFFSLAMGSTAIYTYTPELYPTEIRTTGMGIASAWGRVGAVSLLLTFGFLIESHGPAVLFIVCDAILLIAAMIVFIIGPATRGRTLEATSRGYTRAADLRATQ
jgi:putative MFS transporter